ncbi:hypothetical protein FRC14_005079 [Serendipita sp. 396]|nr:hypothetical protein FRC14_005079 [Serendipita sp. 396]
MPKHKLLKWLTKLFKIPSRKPSSQSRELQANLSKLPIELIEYILLSAAYDPDLLPLTLNLLRLSHWTQTLLQPFVYHTVSLHSDSQAQKFLWAITRRPELCKHVKEFCVPRVNIFKRAWPRHHVADLCLPYVAALDKGAPHLRTLAKIFPILFLEDPETADSLAKKESEGEISVSRGEAVEGGDDGWQDLSCTPLSKTKASNLLSVTIHALTLSPLSPTPSGASSAPLMHLPPSVTLSGFGTSSLSHWDFSSVQRLRFTSVVNGGTLRIDELLLLPRLTHLALPLWRSTVASTKKLLALSSLKRLALFVLFDTGVQFSSTTATDTDTTGPTTTTQPVASSSATPTTNPTGVTVGPLWSSNPTSSTSQAVPQPTQTNTTSVMNPNASNASLQAVFSESEALKKMQDDRLILFNIREMVTLCKVSTERFWGEIEFRATCGEAHFILGQWRELAGRTLTG